jgi:hypothetical protein
MARMNNMGEMGSPCLRPRSCLTGFPGIPLRRILEEVVDKMRLIQSLHFVPKLKVVRTSNK